MKISENQAVWIDNFDSIIYLVYLFCFATSFIIAVTIFNGDLIGSKALKENMDKIIPITLMGGLISSYIIYSLIKRTFIIILKKGIILDPIKFVRVTFFSRVNTKTVSRRTFIDWKDISILYFENHEVRGGRLAEIDPFLIVKTNKEKYQARLEDVLGFVEALKKLNKFNLLTKEALEFVRKYPEMKRR